MTLPNFPQGVDPLSPENVQALAAKPEGELRGLLALLVGLEAEERGQREDDLNRPGGVRDQIQAFRQALAYKRQPPAQVVGLTTLTLQARRPNTGE